MNHNLPLCVDLDGTLLKTDTLHELLLQLIKTQPWQIFLLPFILLSCITKGKQFLKLYLISRISLNPDVLPYNLSFLEFLKLEKNKNRQLILVTGCHEILAKKISWHTGLFSEVIGTTESTNLTGTNKALLLVSRFGDKGFDYAGNSFVDAPIWEKANNRILVNASKKLTDRLAKKFSFEKIFDPRAFSLTQLVKGIRIHQWAKNALIFLPALTAHTLLDSGVLITLAFAFLAFSCCASFNYVINDLLDLEDDRKHHRKQYRPFASGSISIQAALMWAFLLLITTIIFLQGLPLRFVWLLVFYFFATNLYSFRLKKVPILDVSILAGLYTLRVLAGAVAIKTEPSFWLIGFSAFLFFSLAIIKRLSELYFLLNNKNSTEVKARGYLAQDIPALQGLGTSSAIAAVLVLALYINSDVVRVLYNSPNQLWLLCPVLLIWLGRAWLVTGRGHMHDDPVVFALKDKISWLIFSIGAAVMISAKFF